MKKFEILPNKLLRTFYNFEQKCESHNNFSISDLKMILFLSQYRDTYSSISFRYTELRRLTGIRKITSLNQTLIKFGWIKNKETNLYTVQLSSDWRVDTTPQNQQIYTPVNTLNNRKNVNRFSKLPMNVKELLFKSNDLILWKLTFFILYKTHTDPHIDFKFDLNDLYDRLMIKQPKHRVNEYRMKMKRNLDILYNANFIGDCNVLSNTLIFYKNKDYIENKIKKCIP